MKLHPRLKKKQFVHFFAFFNVIAQLRMVYYLQKNLCQVHIEDIKKGAQFFCTVVKRTFEPFEIQKAFITEHFSLFTQPFNILFQKRNYTFTIYLQQNKIL